MYVNLAHYVLLGDKNGRLGTAETIKLAVEAEPYVDRSSI